MELGHEWLVLTDHSPQLRVANGLTAERLPSSSASSTRSTRRSAAQFRLLKGIEVDILDDGGLDQTDAMLGQLDLVTASVHSKLKMNRAPMTQRMVAAVSNPRVNVLGHCTGRLVEGSARHPAAVGLRRPGRSSRPAPSTTPPSRSTAVPSGATRPTS